GELVAAALEGSEHVLAVERVDLRRPARERFAQDVVGEAGLEIARDGLPLVAGELVEEPPVERDRVLGEVQHVVEVLAEEVVEARDEEPREARQEAAKPEER